jgi:putative aminopeptidase FrvX
MCRLALVATLMLMAAPSWGSDPQSDLTVLMEVLSVSGREEQAAEAVLERLPEGLSERDRLGNVVVTLGKGSPRRLLACGLDEPGFLVTKVREDGYLRLRPAGGGARGALWAQGFEGQKVWISTRGGRVTGAVTIPSVHLHQDGPANDELFGPQSAFVDVGAESAAEVHEQGIQVLDPVGLQQRMTSYGPQGERLIAGPAAQSKAACAAQLAATRGLAAGEVDGTLEIAWLRLELWNRKGIEHLVEERGPFDQVLIASRGFGWSSGEQGFSPTEVPDIGSGALSTGEVTLLAEHGELPHLAPSQAWYTGGPDWEAAKHGFFGLPARYRDTPVETISMNDLQDLAQALVDWAGRGEPIGMETATLTEGIAWESKDHAEAAAVLSDLIGAYGVSTREEEVREAVKRRLPEWAKPEIDARGNLLVHFGSGEEHVAFVAHLDEVGFAVEEILEDGRLQLAIKGGLSPSAWEAKSAIVHGGEGPVAGVFEPREGWLEAETRRPPEALTAFIGTRSRDETAARGVQVGDTVTMPKQMRRLGRHRAVARAFDDRVGSTAMLLALSRLDPESVTRRYTFAWVVEEEIGLFGSVALAGQLADLDRVHPVDTFVSSDDPYPDVGFAEQPLGKGVVLRAMDNGYLADREAIEHVRQLAVAQQIPTQVGFTGGGNDGIAFIHLGATNMPLSWPGRYSHSPAEVMDLRDLEALVDLIVALVDEPQG